MRTGISVSLLRSTLTAASVLTSVFLLYANTSGAQRLPENVRPEHYALRLSPDLKSATYSGVETIDVTITQPSTTITVNSRELAFHSVKITTAGHEQTATVTLDKDKQQATFTVPEMLPAGKATIADRVQRCPEQ